MYSVPQIDFLGIFQAAMAARDRKAQMEQDKLYRDAQMEQWKFDRDQKVAADKATKERAAAYTSALEQFYAGNPNSLRAQFPEEFGKISSQEITNQKTQQELQSTIERNTATVLNDAARQLQSDPASAPRVYNWLSGLVQGKQIRPDALQALERFRAPDNFVEVAPQPTPADIDAIQKEASLRASLGTKEQDPLRPTGEMIEAASIIRKDLNVTEAMKDPRWASVLDRVQRTRATQVNNMVGGSQKLTNEATSKLQKEIEEGQQALGMLEDIKSLGDPSAFLSITKKKENAKLSLMDLAKDVPFVRKLTPDERSQLQKATDFEQMVKSYMLAQRRIVTGTGGGEKEMEEIEKSLLSGRLTPEQFTASLARADRQARRALAIKMDMLANGVNVTDPDYYVKLRRRFAEEKPENTPSYNTSAPPPPTALEALERAKAAGLISEAEYQEGVKEAGGQ